MRVFEPPLHRNYALFWSSDLIASVGQFVREVAPYWLAYELPVRPSLWGSRIVRNRAAVLTGRRVDEIDSEL